MNRALVLEHLMLHRRYGELVAQLRAATPVHVVDQLDAATDHAHQFMTTAAHAALGESNARTTDAAGVPGWLRLPLLDTLTTWFADQAATCRHQPHPDRPEPVIAAAWKPGLVVCTRCAPMTGLPRNSDRDRTCDRCGRVCAGVEHGDGIYPGMVQVGALVYQYGVCGQCRPDGE
ncbi:hypothetical protein AWW66_11000 [Micromonospora rosaria]|uniref:Uncharacterized protein n=1 Tax=Micromonospora rosaria TaxID=47874 RepID=A0A136PTY4_9ACTN|nr:hypothetical protein [Micromonospora rosaria]KXK61960.1 hypothetical protein AWW66_11000 [Micromonospora rosaria]